MFREDKDALRRMEEALLAEEEAQGDQDWDDEAEFYEEPDGEEELVVRNFANHYRAYSNHKTDVDLDRFSREVYEPRKKSRANLYLTLLAILLTAGIVMAVAWWVWRLGLVG